MDETQQIEIPWQSLSDDALMGVIQEYVTREGTDYGTQEYSLEEKCAAVRDQLRRGEAVITWNEGEQTCSIVATR